MAMLTTAGSVGSESVDTDGGETVGKTPAELGFPIGDSSSRRSYGQAIDGLQFCGQLSR